MDDTLRKLALDLGLEEEFEAALRSARRADDYEMALVTVVEPASEASDSRHDIASVFLITFARD